MIETATTGRVRPTEMKILVRRVEQQGKTKSGIVLPGLNKEKPREGFVVEVGPGKQLENGRTVKPDFTVGDRVIFSEYAGTEIKVNEVMHLILDAGDVLAVVEGDGEIG